MIVLLWEEVVNYREYKDLEILMMLKYYIVNEGVIDLNWCLYFFSYYFKNVILLIVRVLFESKFIK